MSVVDWVCKKISLESASEQLSAITISRQQVLPSKLDACANVTTWCCKIEGLKIREKKGSPRECCDVSLIYKSIENYLYNIEKNATKTRKNKKI